MLGHYRGVQEILDRSRGASLSQADVKATGADPGALGADPGGPGAHGPSIEVGGKPKGPSRVFNSLEPPKTLPKIDAKTSQNRPQDAPKSRFGGGPLIQLEILRS